MNAARAGWLACLCVLSSAVAAAAQRLPDEPIVLANGRVTLGGDVSATIGPSDPGFFNYTDYEHSALRMLRVDLSGLVKAGDHVSFLGEIRTENTDSVQPYALFVRIRPWTNRNIDIQAGRLPPTFGAFARRTYASDNPLIGYPLTYQYLTSLRPDSLPASADDLLRMRARGWLSNFLIGNTTPDHGVPVVNAFRWDTGVQVHAASQVFDGTVSVTTGTLSNPLVRDDNPGKQVAGRFTARPLPGLVAGVSLARGPFVTTTAARGAVGDGHTGDFTQDAWGADVEYSRGHYLLRFETVTSRWTLPMVRAPFITDPLSSTGTSIEGRYRLRPGLYVAGRVDHLGFSEVHGSTRTLAWDAPVTRYEVGAGYSIQRNLLLKVEYQHDSRDAGLAHTANPVAAQLVFWF
ncbi:MAG TPA: hypothetical protein VL309_03125 [Vicinamibacterales bacterium]|jgi:hypothetical protein|nr:hypothetical protein [Vicinamibacterales bacterium]